jgi:hypothetical protein
MVSIPTSDIAHIVHIAQAYMGTPPESDFGTEGIGNDIAKGLPSVCNWDEVRRTGEILDVHQEM